MVSEELAAYTLDCETIVDFGEAVDLTPLDDGRLLVAELNRYIVYNANYTKAYTSGKYSQIFTTENEKILVRDGDDLLLLELDGKVAVNLGSLEGWTNVELIADQSGYDSGELVGSPVYYFTFDGFENRRYSTVEFSYFPDSGKVNRTDGVDVGN